MKIKVLSMEENTSSRPRAGGTSIKITFARLSFFGEGCQRIWPPLPICTYVERAQTCENLPSAPEEDNPGSAIAFRSPKI